jgi:hypothetical protein
VCVCVGCVLTATVMYSIFVIQTVHCTTCTMNCSCCHYSFIFYVTVYMRHVKRRASRGYRHMDMAIHVWVVTARGD